MKWGLCFFSGIFLIGSVFALGSLDLEMELEHSQYKTFFEYAQKGVDDTKNECAKFVNRIFWARFGKRIWGNAWDLPVREGNKEFLKVVWRIPDSEFENDSLWVSAPEERVEHFRSLYRFIDKEEYPIGVLGFLYKYSQVKEILQKSQEFFPQTHVSFLAGKKWFKIQNKSLVSRSIQEILEDQYGEIHDFERKLIHERLMHGKYFVGKKISLETMISPMSSFWISDYLVEEQFRFSRSGSLFGAFLRKHRNNKKEALLRPVSFSQISDTLILEQEKQDE